ncbi:hypothetical protein D3C83_326330 [compost metagenome]
MARERIGLEKKISAAFTPRDSSKSSSAIEAISNPAPSCTSAFSTRRSGLAFTA